MRAGRTSHAVPFSISRRSRTALCGPPMGSRCVHSSSVRAGAAGTVTTHRTTRRVTSAPSATLWSITRRFTARPRPRAPTSHQFGTHSSRRLISSLMRHSAMRRASSPTGGYRASLACKALRQALRVALAQARPRVSSVRRRLDLRGVWQLTRYGTALQVRSTFLSLSWLRRPISCVTMAARACHLPHVMSLSLMWDVM